ncbi:MAG TPA: VCBS repeat-containing protein, partial [Terriglobales bacterium]|nr:VCBS repeat-containing protein [Terriglobales bacterium]
MNTGSSFTQKKVSDVPDPNDISVNDVNQDGLDDILLARFGCPENEFCGDAADRPVVDYFRNKGDGTFAAQIVIDVPGDRLLDALNQPAAADLNGDGLKDIAVFSEVGGGPEIPGNEHAEVFVAIQQPDGSFSAPKQFLTNLPGGSVSGVLEDINRNGKVDMVVSTDSSVIGSFINSSPPLGCIPSDQPHSVQICLPGNSPATSPVQILAVTHNTLPIEAMKVYVDGVSKFFTKDDLLSGRINMPVGTHLFEVKAWDRNGAFGQAISFTVGNGCIVSGIDRTVKICAPANGATVTSPVHIEGTFATAFVVNAAQVYVDGVLNVSAGSTQRVDTSLPIAAGKHRITLKGWDNGGQFSQTVNVTVQ